MNKQVLNINYQHKLNPILNLAQSTNSTNILKCQTTTIKHVWELSLIIKAHQHFYNGTTLIKFLFVDRENITFTS